MTTRVTQSIDLWRAAYDALLLEGINDVAAVLLPLGEAYDAVRAGYASAFKDAEARLEAAGRVGSSIFSSLAAAGGDATLTGPALEREIARILEEQGEVRLLNPPREGTQAAKDLSRALCSRVFASRVAAARVAEIGLLIAALAATPQGQALTAYFPTVEAALEEAS